MAGVWMLLMMPVLLLWTLYLDTLKPGQEDRAEASLLALIVFGAVTAAGAMWIGSEVEPPPVPRLDASVEAWLRGRP